LLTDLKRRASEWQGKRNRLKRVMIVAGLVVLAVVLSIGWNLLQGVTIRWAVSAFIGCAGLLTFLVTLSAYANTMLVSMYYTACYRHAEAPDELELVTGTVEDVQRMEMPYIGALYHVTVDVAGETMRFYCPGRLLRGVQPRERIRLLAHDLFAVRVTTTELGDTELVEAGGKSTQSA
jgi:hypothetical protein